MSIKPVVNLRSKCAVLLSVVDWQVDNGTYSTHRGVAMKAAVEALLGSQWGEGWVDKPLSALTSTALKDMRSYGLGALAPGPILGPARLGEPWPLPYKLSDGRLESDYYRRLRQLLGAVSAEMGVTVEEIKAPERRNTRKSNLAAALKEVLAFQFATNQPTYLAVERCVDQECEEGRIGPVSASAYKTGALPFVRKAIETGLLVKGASQLNGLKLSELVALDIEVPPKRLYDYRRWCVSAFTAFASYFPGVVEVDYGVRFRDLAPLLGTARRRGTLPGDAYNQLITTVRAVQTDRGLKPNTTAFARDIAETCASSNSAQAAALLEAISVAAVTPPQLRDFRLYGEKAPLSPPLPTLS